MGATVRGSSSTAHRSAAAAPGVATGRFDAGRFVANARDPQVRMIELKLSQGAKPGHGGVLPAAKVSAEISATRGVSMGQDCVSPARHSAFSTPLGLLEFVARLRECFDVLDIQTVQTIGAALSQIIVL